ncbi:APC family permease [Neomegalonema sp.]|uniref:APC family permease n=1 Tax=Neomegalonema sp. TaxID=2039713 RepID=UPI002603C991|nr:APC family permease [Neomegalonema sp.]MDD2867465.1 APC family permease [Neomegalonema sp.]
MTETSGSPADQGTQGRATLQKNCLPYPEVVAQSVAVIAPSTVPAAIIGLIFATAGNGTWLSFLLGMAGMMLIGGCINQFARRSASPGSLYTYIVQGLGPTPGILGGWALMLGYILTGMSTLCGFAIIADLLLKQWTGFSLGTVEWFVVGAGLTGYIASRNVRMSAKTMLFLEAVALLSVVTLGVLIWSYKGFALDPAQLKLEGASMSGVLLGVVLVVFGFSGFESSTSLGDEAKDPLRSIPRSVTQSVVVSGLFFIFSAYVVVFGFSGEAADLGRTEAPLHHLSQRYGLDWLGTVINVGILMSFFACTLAAINSTARILYSMSNHGLFFQALGEAHARNRTPHVAVFFSALLTLALPVGAHLLGVSAFDAQGHFGTVASFGFIVVYILIAVAAPLYLRRIGQLTTGALLCSGGGLLFMAFPILGVIGDVFPLSGNVNALLLGVFALYMLAGFGWLRLERSRRPQMIDQVQGAIEQVRLSFSAAGKPQ